MRGLTPNKLFFVFFVSLLVAGAWIGHWLSSFANVDSVKLLTVLGISYQLLGIVVLSETISTNASLKKFIVNWLSGILIWACTVVHLGVGVTAFALFLAELSMLVESGSYPSARIVASAAISFMFYSFLPAIVVHDFVFVPVREKHTNLDFRSRFFGAFLIFTGTGVQLIAAVLDFLR
jgi:hypothetical protein